MRIDGFNGAGIQPGAVAGYKATDAVSRTIRQQIETAQKQLQELAMNKDLTPDEKMKKRQELQKKIAELNNQLRQHEAELRREQQAEAKAAEEVSGGSRKAGTAENDKRSAGLSQAGMQAMISADTAMEQAQVQGSVATRMEGKAGVLESEIKMDAARGASTEKKEEELAETEQIAANATASQINIIGEANKKLKEAAKADATTGTDKTEKSDNKSAKAEKKEDALEEKQKVTSDQKEENDASDATDEVSGQILYTPVDIRL